MNELAFAKLTLTLRLLDKREDGFNNLEAFTVFLPEINDEVFLNGDQNFELLADNLEMSADDSNLVVKAKQVFYDNLKRQDDQIHENGLKLVKKVPIAAGLGGGSADAGATLRLLNQSHGHVFSIDQLLEMAATLGSDVPACVYSKALWMKGRGEVVEPLEQFNSNGAHVIVVTPTIFCPTPLIYKRYEEMGRPHDEGSAQSQFSNYFERFHNDLSIPAFDIFPNLVEFKKTLENISNLEFYLAGSGSTLFAVTQEDNVQFARQSIAREIPAENLRLLASSVII